MNNSREDSGKPETADVTEDGGSGNRRLFATVPNAICAGRFVGSLFLPVLAHAEQSSAFLILALLLSFSDWIDGKIAIIWNQRSVYGARLDSVADVTMYFGILWGLIVLSGNVIWAEKWWLFAALGSYAMTIGYAFWKYRRLPSYHTRGAKISWFLAIVAVVAAILYSESRPLRFALAFVFFTNVETTIMTRVLPKWHADVLTLTHALKLMKDET